MDPLKYTDRRGIVEIHTGIENEKIEYREDLYEYVQDHLEITGEDFAPDFCAKDKNTGRRHWFACKVCNCELFSVVTLQAHVSGQKHTKKALLKVRVEQGVAPTSIPSQKRKRDITK
jgi:hypothetical protein